MSKTSGEHTVPGLPSQPLPDRPERRLLGVPACAGVAIGPVFRTAEPTPEIARTRIHASDIQAEGARFDAAILQSRKQLAKLRARLAYLPEDSQNEIAP